MVGEEGRHAGPDHECRQASRRVGRDPPQVWQAGRVTALLGIATRLKLARLIQIVPAGSPRVRPLAAAGFSGGADIVMLDETRSPARAEASTLAAVGAEPSRVYRIVAPAVADTAESVIGTAYSPAGTEGTGSAAMPS